MGLHEHHRFQNAETAELLLIDTARRLQLPDWKHDKAVVSYEALCTHVDRPGSPLHNLVDICYPSGSFGIGTVVASRVRQNQHDLDVVIELLLSADTPPAIVLGLLYMAIRGEPGSRYHDKTTLNSRCVTVEYEDGFTVDLMPIVRDASNIARRGSLFHYKAGEGTYRKPVNPFGFKSYYNATVDTDPAFVRAFRALDEKVVAKALVEPMEAPVRLEEKSARTVSVQLLKRRRDVRHRKADRKGQRCVPSIVLAAWALAKPEPRPTLLWELHEQATFIKTQLAIASATGQLVDVYNPVWPGVDRFTDRWPSSHLEQRALHDDMADLIAKLEVLASNALSPTASKEVLEELFGETAATYAVDEMMKRHAEASQAGALKFGVTGAVLAGTAASSSTRAAVRSSTDFGGLAD